MPNSEHQVFSDHVEVSESKTFVIVGEDSGKQAKITQDRGVIGREAGETKML